MQPIQQYLEQTNLSPMLRSLEVEDIVAQAKKYGFCGLCLPPYWIKKARRDLEGAPINLVTVIGFPLGFHRSEVKVQELKSAIRDGANELDVVINLSAVKMQAFDWIKPEIAQLALTAHQSECMLKVILETCYLSEEEIVKSAKVCAEAGADFIKTSTGFGKEGAKLEHVRLLKSILPSGVGIKASGGIRNYEQAKAFIEAGAERIGTSAGVDIIEEALKI